MFIFLNNSSVIFLDEIFIMYSDFISPHFSRISEIITHNSASACKLFVPTKSASNCKNSLNLPGPGFSFLQTVPSWYLLNGLGIKTGVDLKLLIAAGNRISDFLQRPNQADVARAFSS